MPIQAMSGAAHASPGTSDIVLDRSALAVLYGDAPDEEKRRVLPTLGPLEPVFARFLAHERVVRPPSDPSLRRWFDACCDPARSSAELLAVLRSLAPGNGRIGMRQVTRLVDLLRARVRDHLERAGAPLDLLPHDHAFGSGGDFWKTSHATTCAAIVAAPRVTICKTGTINVTAEHGSVQATRALGYRDHAIEGGELNARLAAFGFAFVPLSSLGFPYSEALRTARRRLWDQAVAKLAARQARTGEGWRRTVRSTPIPLDVFKIVSPNAQVLDPVHHSTGVCHLDMLPYVLGIYLHLGSEGFIAHAYDGIDEVSNASGEADGPVNVVVGIDAERVTITEFGPEDVGLRRAELGEIEEDKDLAGDSATFWRILRGEERGPRRDFVLANTALLLAAAEPAAPCAPLVDRLRTGVRASADLIDSGAAHRNFSALLHAG